jgi:hypothetical protein
MSSMPGPAGSATVKSVAARPTTTSRASIPDQSRYSRSAWCGWTFPAHSFIDASALPAGRQK